MASTIDRVSQVRRWRLRAARGASTSRSVPTPRASSTRRPSTIEPFSIEFGIVGRATCCKWIQASWRREADAAQRPDHPRRLRPPADVRARVLRRADHRDHVPGARRRVEGGRVPQDEAPARARRSAQRSAGRPTARPSSDARSRSCGCAPRSGSRIDGLDDIEYDEQDRLVHDQAGRQEALHRRRRFPQIEPTKIEFPTHHRHDRARVRRRALGWYEQYVAAPDADAQRQGALEFLSPDRRDGAVPDQAVRGRAARASRSCRAPRTPRRSSA